jgi:hypothetical protein
LEDCLLSEQPGVLKEFFGNRRGYLPEGSVLLFGSLSHLALRGLETYAEEVVKSFKTFSGMLGGGVTVAHMVHFPLGGIESEGLIRDMYDLDAWLRSGVAGTMLSMPISREQFWKIMVDDSMELSVTNTHERTLFMPENFTNSHKIRTISGSVAGMLPAKIEPMPERSERKLVAVLMNEINEKFSVEVNGNPVLDRCSGDVVFSNNNCNASRIIAIGGSHVARLACGLSESGIRVINLTKPGWILNEKSAADIKQRIRSHNITSNDIILIDPVSNNVFCGTDTDGNLADPLKIDDGWHVTGELNVRPKSYLKVVINHLKMVTEILPDAKVAVLAPIPRYVAHKCCENPEHITNFMDISYHSDISEGLDKVEDLLTAWIHTLPNEGLLIDYRAGVDNGSVPAADMTVGGDSIWEDDPVHPAPPLYNKLVAEVTTALSDYGFHSEGGLSKRPRLESMVVRRQAPDLSAPARPQSWSAGVFPDPPKRGNGGKRSGLRGGQRGFSRGRAYRQRGGGNVVRGGPFRGGRGRFWAPRKF